MPAGVSETESQNSTHAGGDVGQSEGLRVGGEAAACEGDDDVFCYWKDDVVLQQQRAKLLDHLLKSTTQANTIKPPDYYLLIGMRIVVSYFISLVLLTKNAYAVQLIVIDTLHDLFINLYLFHSGHSEKD